MRFWFLVCWSLGSPARPTSCQI